MAKLSHRDNPLGEKGYGKDYLEVAKYTINYKDVFDLKYLYMIMHEWLIENSFASRDDSKFGETFYLQRNKPAGRDLLIRWRLVSKTPMGSNIWEYHLDIDWLVLLLNKVELIKNGKKVKAEKGEVQIDVSAKLVIKDKGILGKSKETFNGKLKDWLISSLYKKNYEVHQMKLAGDANKLRDTINQYLGIQATGSTPQMGEFFKKAK